jgi:hypothetical protein
MIEQVEKLRPALFVQAHDLAIEHCRRCECAAEFLRERTERFELVSVPRHQTAATLFNVGEGTKPVVFQFNIQLGSSKGSTELRRGIGWTALNINSVSHNDRRNRLPD